MSWGAPPGAVASISGDGTLITNSLSTGAVTLSLGTAPAHNYWGNNTGSTGAPGYHQPSYSDLSGTVPAVTSFSAGALSPLFTTSIATATTTPALSFSLSNAAQNSVLAGPATGGAGAPSYQTAPTISAANMTSFPTLNQSTTGNAATATTATTASALAGTPTTCSAGQAAAGIVASGNATGCFTPAGSGTVNSGTQGQLGWYATSTTAISGNANFALNTGGTALANWNNIATQGMGTPTIGWVSNVLAVTANQNVTLATAPTAGTYHLIYYTSLNTPCTTGSNSTSFTFGWTDSNSARTLITGPLSMGSAQSTSSYVSGDFNLYVGSGNITYTSTISGTCSTGTSSYDIHVTLERLQ